MTAVHSIMHFYVMKENKFCLVLFSKTYHQ